MADHSLSVFVDSIRRSGLIDPARLDSELADYKSLAETSANTEAFARRLAIAELLTPWQIQLLRKGQIRGFFLGKYKLLRELGTGGMSNVYLGEHQLLRRRVAIKVLQMRQNHLESLLERFRREVCVLAAMDHPHVVRVFDSSFDGARHYLVMEFVDGPNIMELLTRGGPLPWQTAARYAADAAEGLNYAHERGFIHRDVKPANLLVTSHGAVKVSDLGLARVTVHEGPSITLDDGTVLGTVDYLAPEQALNSHDVCALADVYGLGCTLYHMLTGLPPFHQGTLTERLIKHQTEMCMPIRSLQRDVPVPIAELCARMMSKIREERPTMPMVAAALRKMLEGATAPRQVVASRPAWTCAEDFPAGAATQTRAQADEGANETGEELSSMSRREVEPETPSMPHPIGKVRVQCPKCRVGLYAPRSAIGKRAKCPKCAAAVPIVAPQSHSPLAETMALAFPGGADSAHGGSLRHQSL